MGVRLVLGYWTPETSGSLASYLECWISLSFGGEWNRKKNVFNLGGLGNKGQKERDSEEEGWEIKHKMTLRKTKSGRDHCGMGASNKIT